MEAGAAHGGHDGARGGGHDDARGGGHDDAPGAADMHIWLDPRNAAAMVEAIAKALSAADPAAAAAYRANAEALEGRLGDLDAALAKALGPVAGLPYVVLHDGYRYFERRYGLTPAGAIAASPERRPSARKLTEIRAAIASTGAACVFSEPQFEPSLVLTVIEGTEARIGVLDPLGAELTPGADAYFALMHNLAAAFNDCLAPQRK